ncbi:MULTISPECIES: NYN domain-containing protein [Sulfitobacter]|uniref:RNase NYN domain-containing protein n=1 Tax=Sulfitobacter dubius TaxID=218673 RepID=A0ABY3ZGD1_9RHOB|nr:hypothetical protein [Sulfitobacter dubius]UOA13705.1 hypothetical protein DSM109990_00497 [Sulfitobacter dubius]WOI27787.1 hypothetical protein R1T39_08705 [Sulfitobacter dubius]
MICPFLLLLGSLVLTIAGASIPGWQDLTLLGVPCVIASAILLLRALAQPKRAQKKWIIVDGSNVMYWKSGEPSIKVVREIVDELRDRGYTPGVVFDANAGYLLIGRYQHDNALSRQLDLPVDRVMVVPKGTPADPYILQSARDYGGQVVSRDRFRDWADAHPEIAEPGHLVKGGYQKGKLWLDLKNEALV